MKKLFRLLPIPLLAICAFAISACVYDEPITSASTQKIDTRLLGDWTNGKDKLSVRELNAKNYIVVYDGMFFTAYPSGTFGVPLLSVQHIDSANTSILPTQFHPMKNE